MKQDVKRHFDHIAKLYDKFKEKNWYYYDQLKQFIDEFIPKGARVAEIGCGTGELLNHTQPSYGLGIDISERMVERAREKFPHLRFMAEEVETIAIDERFDYVLMIDLIDHIQDIWDVLRGTENLVKEGSTLCIATINPLWQPLFTVAEALKLKMPEGPHNFVPMNDIVNLLEIFDYSIVKKQMRFLIPKKIPLISDWINRVVPHVPVIRNLSAVQTIVARKEKTSSEHPYSASVVIPCHNEEENVETCARLIPQMGLGTEIIFVNDGSTDRTEERLRSITKEHPHVKVVSYPENRGKGFAVQKGFEVAAGDILMIFDADLTVPADDLFEFYYPLAHGKARFVNGSRLVYPMEEESMRTLNLWGNQFFGMLMSWLVGQRLTDTLCGTKAFFREDYRKMRIGRDKWGDFDFLFATKELNLKLVEIPVHYKRRQFGESKMRTLRHSLLLTRVCLWGFFHIKLMGLFRRFSR